MFSPIQRTQTGYHHIYLTLMNCELCNTESWCYNRFGIYACETCKIDLLP